MTEFYFTPLHWLNYQYLLTPINITYRIVITPPYLYITHIAPIYVIIYISQPYIIYTVLKSP